MIRKEFGWLVRRDKCVTKSRGSGVKYHNKYTEYFGKKGYKGINKEGIFTKRYDYGVVGHCCIGLQYWFHRCGFEACVPKNKEYIWNTNRYADWLKSEPKIPGYGKVDWHTNSFKHAELGDVVFKGNKGESGYTHTCMFVKTDGTYVWTRDWNVWGKYKGKRYNNGVLHKRKISSYKWGVAHMPFPTF